MTRLGDDVVDEAEAHPSRQQGRKTSVVIESLPRCHVMIGIFPRPSFSFGCCSLISRPLLFCQLKTESQYPNCEQCLIPVDFVKRCGLHSGKIPSQEGSVKLFLLLLLLLDRHQTSAGFCMIYLQSLGYSCLHFRQPSNSIYRYP